MKLTRWALVILLFSAASTCWNRLQYPELIDHFNEAIPAGFAETPTVVDGFFGGDHLQVAYLGWKLKQYFTGDSPSIFQDYFNFAAKGRPFFDINFGLQYQMIAFWSYWLGDIAAYNFAVIVLSQILLAAAVYFMMGAVTRSEGLRILAAITAALIPHRINQIMGGHSGGVTMLLVPLYFGALIRHFENRGRYWDAFAGFVLFYMTISDEHQGYYLMIASMIIFTSLWIKDSRSLGWKKALSSIVLKWRHLVLGLIAVVAYGLILNAMVLSDDGGAKVVRTFATIRKYSVPLPFFFTFDHVMNIGNVFAWSFPAILLALLLWDRATLWSGIKSRYFVFFPTFAICCVLMAGVGRNWSQSSGIYQLFYYVMPFFKYQRVPDKMYSVAMMLLFICVGLVFEKSRTLAKRGDFKSLILYRAIYWSILICFIVQAGTFFEFIRLNKANLKLEKIAFDSGQVVSFMRDHLTHDDIVLTIPATDKMNRYPTINQNLAMRTNLRFAHGYNGTPPAYFDPSVPQLMTYNNATPSKTATEWIKKFGYTHILAFKGESELDPTYDLVGGLGKLTHLKELICDEAFCLYKIDFAKLDEDPPRNSGLTGPTLRKKLAGQWMISEEFPELLAVPEPLRTNLKVFSYFEVPPSETTSPRKVAVIFEALDDESLWVLQENKTPIEFPPENWQIDGRLRRVEFVTDSKYFLLAVRNGRPLISGKPETIAGHFIIKVQAVN